MTGHLAISDALKGVAVGKIWWLSAKYGSTNRCRVMHR